MKFLGKPGLYLRVGLIGLVAVSLSAQNLEEPAPQVTSEVQSSPSLPSPITFRSETSLSGSRITKPRSLPINKSIQPSCRPTHRTEWVWRTIC